MDFQKEIEKYISKVENWENFSLIRIGDGEKMLICNQAFTWQALSQDKRFSEGKETKLWNDLKQTLNIVSEDFIYWVACSCCNQWVKDWSFQNIQSRNFTYANIWINWNYKRFKEWITTTSKEFIVVANYEWKFKEYPFKWKTYYAVQDDCVNVYEDNRDELLKLVREAAIINSNQIFLFSCWPLAKVFIAEMYKVNKYNTYLDVWSALDEFTKGRQTRWFQTPNWYYTNKICIF